MINIFIVGGDSRIGRFLFNKFRKNKFELGINCVIKTTRNKSSRSDIYYEAAHGLLNPSLIPGNTYVIWCLPPVYTVPGDLLISNFLQALGSKCKKFIFLSSDLVFPPDAMNPTPSHKRKAQSNYGRDKIISENTIMSYCSEYAVLRLGKVLETSDFFDLMKKNVRNKIPFDAYENYFFSPIVLNDIWNLLKQNVHTPGQAIYHLSATDQISYYHASKILLDLAGNDPGLVRPALMDKSHHMYRTCSILGDLFFEGEHMFCANKLKIFYQGQYSEV